MLGGHFDALQRAVAGVPTLVVLLPGHEVVLKDYEALLKLNEFDPELHERGRGHARLIRLLEAAGFEVIDLTEKMLDEPDRSKLFFEVDWHFSHYGCRKIAEWLVPEISSRLNR